MVKEYIILKERKQMNKLKRFKKKKRTFNQNGKRSHKPIKIKIKYY